MKHPAYIASIKVIDCQELEGKREEKNKNKDKALIQNDPMDQTTKCQDLCLKSSQLSWFFTHEI